MGAFVDSGSLGRSDAHFMLREVLGMESALRELGANTGEDDFT